MADKCFAALLRTRKEDAMTIGQLKEILHQLETRGDDTESKTRINNDMQVYFAGEVDASGATLIRDVFVGDDEDGTEPFCLILS